MSVILDKETFHKFFEGWLNEQNQHLEELTRASKQSSKGEALSASQLNAPVTRVIQHYEKYYHAKSYWGGEDIIKMFSPTWTSSLEDSFQWIGGWRPSMTFHLLYSKSGSQTEAALDDLMHGLGTTDLGGISPSQLVRVDELHRETIREEKGICEKAAEKQETVADSSMVELSGIENAEEGMVDAVLAPKEEGLKDVLQMADDLRLRTLKGMVEILTPIQAVHFLIAVNVTVI